MKEPKSYRTTAHTNSDHTDIPAAVEFIIDENTARDIIRLSHFVKANNLYKVEKFDYRATYLHHSPEDHPQDADASDEGSEVRMEGNALNVTDTEFWFSAYIKHTDIEVQSKEIPTSELVDHFGLNAELAPSLATSHDVVAYLDTIRLPEALWWFIENADEEASWRTDVFFRLRERMKALAGAHPATKGPARKPVCPKCGSDDVLADAAARWEFDTQAWDLVNVSSKGHSCGNCGASNITFKWIRCAAAGAP